MLSDFVKFLLKFSTLCFDCLEVVLCVNFKYIVLIVMCYGKYNCYFICCALSSVFSNMIF